MYVWARLHDHGRLRQDHQSHRAEGETALFAHLPSPLVSSSLLPMQPLSLKVGILEVGAEEGKAIDCGGHATPSNTIVTPL
jgi:hypothetical protein